MRETDAWSEATFTLRLSKASTDPVRVSWSTADGTAVAPEDFERAAGIVTFAAGETTRTISVRIAGDDKVEPLESFTIELSNSEGAVLGIQRGTCTIENDDSDAPPPPAKRRSARH